MANLPNARPDRSRLLREVLSASPYDHDAVTRGRIAVATILILGVFALLGVHLYKIQCVKHEAFLEQRNEQSFALESSEARRGSIFDRHGRPLALSRLVKSVYAVPQQVESVRETANALSRILGMDAQEIAAKLDLKNEGKTRHFVWIKRRVSQEQADAVASLRLPGVAFREEYKRCYMNGRTACHVLGFTNIDEVGMEGIEAVLDPLLSSKSGSHVLMRDALGRKIVPANGPDSLCDARDGKDVYLSLDLVVQQILEEELDALSVKWTPASVSGIVMDPATGDILALANRPAFDPNDPAAYPKDARRNRALTDPVEPGSTFKPFILAAVLQEKLVSLSQRIDCENGVFTYHGRTLRDASSHGVMTVEEIVSKSSNIGMAKVGVILASACGKKVMREWVRAFDFGVKTDCDMLPLSAESAGRVTELRKWSDYTTTSVSMGHEISVTPMQLIKGYSALANDGLLLQPRIVLATTEPGAGARSGLRHPEPVVIRRTVKADVNEKVVGVMCKVVTEGTGKKGAVEGYVVAGKTGTAQKLMPDRTYSHDKHVGSFVGFAPADDPAVIVLVVVDEPKGAYYGGTVAAPTVARVIERSLKYMGVRPTLESNVATRPR